ncbi:MAG: tRNA pseudouridine(38-40) synthase TruA [Melioribacteraceae bacterium]|nr:tRNA pseudouridine(38-40) synthase TruA [Melioribacteraceae bacterium]
MHNYKLVIQYDGTNYAGWQMQENAETIQQRISDSVEIILKEQINLTGSGRTDAGVHALGQTANFKIDAPIDIGKFKHSLNGILPEDISILECSEVGVNFHSRFDAKKRSYLYFIRNYKSPFFQKYSYFHKTIDEIDLGRLNYLSKLLKGEHNFSSFCKKNSDVENKICNLFDIHWYRRKGFLIFYVEANRFLHGMVKTLVGTLIWLSTQNYSEDLLKQIIKVEDREAASEAFPSKGLFLYKVKY